MSSNPPPPPIIHHETYKAIEEDLLQLLNKHQEVNSSTIDVREALETFGVVPPRSGVDVGSTAATRNRELCWSRPRPFFDSVYTIPRIPLQVRLVRDEETGKLKEVPIERIGDTSNLHRPLGGNLTNKLTEYTRGQVGMRNPFHFGGVDYKGNDSETGKDSDDNDSSKQNGIVMSVNELRTAIEKGGLEVFLRNEPLLKSAPGIDGGLTPDQIYEKEYIENFAAERGIALNEVNNDVEDVDKEKEAAKNSFSQPVVTQQEIPTNTPLGLWMDKFDDDSLFGSFSSSSSSSSGDDESSIYSEEEMEKKLTVNKDTLDKQDLTLAEDESDEKFVDYLLETFDHTKKQKSLPRKIPLHPLLKINNQNGKNKHKSWAVTAGLDISNFHSIISNVLTFPFELDDFQKQAVARLERSECVFIAAHTSAGKTVVAEYAIAMAKKHCTRAIYTSPIKALSNQKYRDFKNKFDDVGLITGDLQISPDSSCLIMTTEILRSMLYRGADLVRDIEWVIFDEVHYINDSERGVVWEEVIIMLPDYVNLIFLSATTPNTIEFSDWIGRTKRKNVHVIRTNYRPVPLSHNLFAGGKLFKIQEGQSDFIEKGHKLAVETLKPKSSKEGKTSSSQPKSGARGVAWQQMGSKQNWSSLVRFLEREELMPCVVFSFSKKKCEEIAGMLSSLSLNTAAESAAVHTFSRQAISRLSPVDSALPQVKAVCEMVKRGIGVHHGGLLPILKEMVEILFSRNLIKVLFATETFAMGVNMPARSVCFNSIRKHDGTQFRELEPGEYTQMAGRAGRRGLDKVGTVILCCFGDEPPPMYILKKMLTGKSTKLQSQFRLTYNMILNLLRVEDMSVEDMIKRSFSEFATQRALTANDYPKLLEKGAATLEKLEAKCETERVVRLAAPDMEKYFKIVQNLLSLNMDLNSSLLCSAGGSGGGALVTGRIIFVVSKGHKSESYVRAPAVVLKPPSIDQSQGSSQSSVGSSVAVCLVLLPDSYVNDKPDRPEKEGELNYIGQFQQRIYVLHEISLDQIVIVSSLKLKFDRSVLLKEAAADTKSSSLSLDPFVKVKPTRRLDVDDTFAMFKAHKKGSDSIEKKSVSQYPKVIEQVVTALIEAETSELTPGKGIDILNLRETTRGAQGSIELSEKCTEMESIILQLRLCESHYYKQSTEYYFIIDRREALKSRINKLQHMLSNEALDLFPDFQQRKSVLHSLGYIDGNDVVTIKGRVTAEINTCEESIILTELIFEGILNKMEPAEIVAALSAFIFQEKTEEDLDEELPEKLLACVECMKTIALTLGEAQKDHGLHIVPEEYCQNSLRFGLIHVVYEWASGVPFSNICELTSVQEGSIVRCMTRLDELCREVRNCARVVGNPILYRKMEAASLAIKRDIVFASSLYVS